MGKLTLENEVLKWDYRTASTGHKETANHQGTGYLGVTIRWGCRLMKLARSTFYHM